MRHATARVKLPESTPGRRPPDFSGHLRQGIKEGVYGRSDDPWPHQQAWQSLSAHAVHARRPRSSLRPANWEKHRFGPWLTTAAKRLRHNVLATALANKLSPVKYFQGVERDGSQRLRHWLARSANPFFTIGHSFARPLRSRGISRGPRGRCLTGSSSALPMRSSRKPNGKVRVVPRRL